MMSTRTEIEPALGGPATDWVLCIVLAKVLAVERPMPALRSHHRFLIPTTSLTTSAVEVLCVDIGPNQCQLHQHRAVPSIQTHLPPPCVVRQSLLPSPETQEEKNSGNSLDSVHDLVRLHSCFGFCVVRFKVPKRSWGDV